jgi:hypothetical protein
MRSRQTASALAITLVFSASAEANLIIYKNKPAFLAATGSTSATGPIPNLGQFFAGQEVTVGNATFSTAPGGDNLSIGGGTGPCGDWTNLIPGHDIALGYENLHVAFDEPVFAIGFDFVEALDTLCPECGSDPVDSPFTVTLYDGALEVGSFTFNAPNDKLAFIGVKSTLPFDSADIVDATGNDDDEYFGEFYAPLAQPVCPAP